MRMTFLAFALMILAAACGPEGKARAASDAVVANAPRPGLVWPLMLQHCLRSPDCDPAADFGKGAGQASGLAETVAWFAETKDVVKEGGQDYGAALTLNAYGARGSGGGAGRPLTIDELPDSLNGANAKRSTLSIVYRTPGGGAPEPYGLAFRSAWVELTDKTLDEARLEISGTAGVLLSETAGAMPAKEEPANGERAAVTPMVFFYPRNLRDDPLAKLMEALITGETLSLRLTAADGGVILQDAIYAFGYDTALKRATDSLADPEIAKPVSERCQRFASQKDAFWKIADVTPALLVCDPRTPEQRR
jgi:hypothetical protein